MQIKKKKQYKNKLVFNQELFDRIDNIVSGTKHDSLEEAIAADIVSSLPVAGIISDFVRVTNSKTRPRRTLQTFDLISSPIPIMDLFTPTNSLIYLNDNGKLPIKLEEIDEFINSIKSPRNLFFKRKG